MLRRLIPTALLLPALLLGGCNWTREMLKPDLIDYKNETTQNRPDQPVLQLPQDLSKPAYNDRFLPPGGTQAGAAQGAAVQPVAEAPKASGDALPKVTNAHIEREGSQRWLVVSGKPEQYWDTIKDFWQDTGFTLAVERPEAGVMETDWAEHKAKPSEGLVKKIWGSMLDMISSTAQRDKFRTRLEPNAQGETEIYISHRGLEETYRDEIERDQTIWTGRPPDPALEAEFLRRLMVRLGSDDKRAAQSLAAADQGPVKKSKIVSTGSASAVELDEGFDRAWRRVGLALDRVGFTVEDRDRAKGLYFVRYAEPDAAPKKPAPQGMFGGIKNLFSARQVAADGQYQIQVSGAAPATRVLVLSKTGEPDNGKASQRILSLLNEQLE